jgi:site-specific DNA-methyltransferase (adenine-specific)
MAENILYYGDNLDILRQHIKDETIDLVYLDPPFKSNQDYNVLFPEQNGSRSAAQIKAFKDTWRWDQSAAAAHQEVVESGPQRVSQVMQGFRTFLGESDIMAYLAMMAPRLVEMRRVLKKTGSIYLHCDPAASHYLKMLMDATFSTKNFRNEIIWCYRGGGRPKKDFGRKHDVILRYAKTNQLKFYPDYIRIAYQAEGIGRTDDSMWGRHGGTDKVYKPHPKGKIPEDWWPMDALNANSPERLGYPTQKPEALLERIIKASSNEGDMVLDPFCGCGTTIAVAQRLNRRWIGIDITHLAVALMKHRLKDMFGQKVSYKVVGEPVSLPDAKTLAENDKYQFQWWALGLVGARPVEQKKGADKGIDGRLYFHDEGEGGKTKQIVFSVKAGHTGAGDVRDLRGVIEREKAEIGVFICIQKPTKAMRTEAASAEFYKSPWREEPYPRLQILTIEELLKGKQIDCPPLGQVNVTFKKAPKAKGKREGDPEIEFPE